MSAEMPPIIMRFAPDTAGVVASMQEVGRQAKDAFERSYNTAIDKAQQKLDELTRRQKVLNQTIFEHSKSYDELEKKRSSANQTELANIDKQMRAIKQLVDARRQEFQTIEQSKIKAEEKGLLSLTHTDAERKALMESNRERLAELQLLRDQIRLEQSAAASSEAGMAKVAAKLAELTQKQREHTAILNRDGEEIAKRQKALENAGESDKKRILGEIEGLRKASTARESELVDIEKRKILLEEQKQLSNATSESERQQIKTSTNAKLVAIGATQDLGKAQKAVNKETEEGGNVLSRYVSFFTGIGGAFLVIGKITEAFRAEAQVVEELNKALEHNRQLNSQMHSDMGTFSKEFGLNSQSQQQSGLQSLVNISDQFRATGGGMMTPEEIGTAASALSPTLHQNGITDINSARFSDLAGNAAVLMQRGFDSNAIRDYSAELFRDNKNLTGGQMNQAFSNVLSASGGSPQVANQLLQAFGENRQKFEAAGMSFQDIEKIFVGQRAAGTPLEESLKLIGQFGQASDRLLGQSPDQLVKLHEEMSVFNGVNKNILGEVSPYLSFAQRIEKQKQLRQAGVPELDQLFSDRVSGKVDEKAFIREFVRITSGLGDEERSRVARAVGGPRNVVALSMAGQFGNVQLPTGGPLTGDTSAAQGGLVEAAIQRANQSLANPTQAGESAFTEAMKLGDDIVGKGVEQNTAMGVGGWARDIASAGLLMPNRQEMDAGAGYLSRLVQLAKLRQDIADGKVQATPTQIANLDTAMQSIGDKVWGGTQVTTNKLGAYSSLQALIKGGATTEVSGVTTRYTRSQELQNAAKDQAGFITNILNGADLHTISHHLSSQQEGGKLFNQSQNAEDAIRRSQPTTQPVGPQSINYNIRNVNYGYSYDSIGAPNSYTTNLG